MGDAVLLDPATGLFACGDSSDRGPWEAARFLREFGLVMERFRGEGPRGSRGADPWDELRSTLTGRIREMLATFPFQGTTTFTGFLLLKGYGESRGLLFHAGDSVLFSYSRKGGVRRLTEPNFWLLGKVRSLYQVDYFTWRRGDRLLMATDGVYDLKPPDHGGLEGCLEELLGRCPVEEVPDELIACGDGRREGRDDLALVAIDPDRCGEAAEAGREND